MNLRTMNQLQSYLAESQRLNLCVGLVSCYVRPAQAVEYDVPIKNLGGPRGMVEVDVEKLKQARDVSVN